MLVARFRLAAPLSSLGVIVASMGQPNGGPEGRRARGKIFDSARRSRQSTSKTATDASVRIMSLSPRSRQCLCYLPREHVDAPRGRDHHADASGDTSRCATGCTPCGEVYGLIPSGSVEIQDASTRARTLGASTVAHRLGTLSGSRSIGNTRSRETYPAGRSGPFGIRGEDHLTPSSSSPAQRSGA